MQTPGDFNGKANNLLISSELETSEIQKAIDQSLEPEDASLSLQNIEATGKVEISTDRVFMEPKVAETLEQLPGEKPLITYFVNSIERIQTGNEIPYSFVSSLTGNQLLITKSF